MYIISHVHTFKLHAIVVLVSWHEIVEGQDSGTCKLLKPFNGIKHVKITGYKTLMKIYVDKLCKYSEKYYHVLLNIRCILLMMVLNTIYITIDVTHKQYDF